MTGQTVVRRRWWVTPLVMVVGGGALTIGAAIGGGPNSGFLAVGMLVVTVVAAVGFVVLGRTRSDIGAIVASAPDERQRTLDLRATATAGVAVSVVLIGGAVVSLAQGHGGEPWVGLCAVSGLSYIVALLVFRNR